MVQYNYLPTGHAAGEECSSTGEGRHITMEESLIIHPTHTDGFVDNGDPVNVGAGIVGVAFNSAAAATDMIAIDTEGIWYLNVVASDGNGVSAVAIGDQLYIATGVVSKIATGIPFGKALSVLTGSASAAVAAVKIHGESLIGGSSLAGHQFTASFPTLAAADVAKSFFIAPAACKIISAYESHVTVAGQAGTLNVEKCTTGEAPAAGDVTLATGWDMTSTANTPVSIASLGTAAATLAASDLLRLKLTAGNAASYAGATVTVLMEWV